MTQLPYSVDELIAVCISRQIEDGELVAQGIATPLVAAGYLLAKLTHAPNLMFVSAIGQSICQDWAPLGIGTIERLWIEKGIMPVGFVDAVCDFRLELLVVAGCCCCSGRQNHPSGSRDERTRNSGNVKGDIEISRSR